MRFTPSSKLTAAALVVAVFGLQGCLAKTAVDLATLPVRAAGKAVDLATTSQSEADEKRGREMRKNEERLGKLLRQYEDVRKDCADGDRRDCEKAQKIYAEIELIKRSIPAPPE